MKINRQNLNPLFNTQAIEQAARQSAQAKQAETARARAAEETLRLQQKAEKVLGQGHQGEGDKPKKDNRGQRPTGYSKDGSVRTGDDPAPGENPPVSKPGGIDLRA